MGRTARTLLPDLIVRVRQLEAWKLSATMAARVILHEYAELTDTIDRVRAVHRDIDTSEAVWWDLDTALKGGQP